MDAGLAWTVVGSAAAVVAIPIAILQLRQGRKAAARPPANWWLSQLIVI